MQKCLLEFYIKLQQHFSTAILYCCLNIAIMWKSVDFPKLKILRVLVFLFKYKFHFNESWIFVAIDGIQKLKTKTYFFQTLKNKIMRQFIENYIREKLVRTTKECIWHTNLKFNVQNINSLHHSCSNNRNCLAKRYLEFLVDLLSCNSFVLLVSE